MKDRPHEQEAVKTTIVGGRPPGSGKPVGPIPRGVEVLVKKAAVDPDFKQLLIARRAGAAEEIDLKLQPSEVAMLNAVPAPQLEAIVARTSVEPRQRKAFLGRAAALMLAALGAGTLDGGCGPGLAHDWDKLEPIPEWRYRRLTTATASAESLPYNETLPSTGRWAGGGTRNYGPPTAGVFTGQAGQPPLRIKPRVKRDKVRPKAQRHSDNDRNDDDWDDDDKPRRRVVVLGTRPD